MPVPTKELAEEVSKEIGAEASDGWFGYRDFNRFLEASLPNAEIDMRKDAALQPNRDESEDGVLPAIRFLKSNIENFPNAEIDAWRPMYLSLEQALPKVKFSGSISPETIYAWTKIARDKTDAGSAHDLKRSWLNFVALGLFNRKLVRKQMGHTEIENAFIDICLPEMRKSGLPQIELDRGEAWLRSYADLHYENHSPGLTQPPKTATSQAPVSAIAEAAPLGANSAVAEVSSESTNRAEAAATRYLGQLVAHLDKPTDFATLSNLVKVRFGEEECADWFGNGKFKKFLSQAAPDAVTVAEGSSYVLPPGMTAGDFQTPSVKGRTVPPWVAKIRQTDENFPNLETTTWPILFRSLAMATQELRWKGSATVKTVNACCTRARKLTEDSAALHLGRKEFNYVAWTLYTRGVLSSNMSPLQVENFFAEALIGRCRAAGFSSSETIYAKAWVGGKAVS